jgi:anti-sigma28 factor (negative regulator of flagellin synthesis)
MIISRAEIESAVSAYRTSRKKKAGAAQSVSFDTAAPLDVEYVSSSEATSFAEMAASVTAEPMYRDALVKDLQQRISQGKYYVPSEQIVEKLLGRLVLEALPA